MCNDRSLFVNLRHLSIPQEVTLGDESSLKSPAEGTVKIDAILPSGNQHTETQFGKCDTDLFQSFPIAYWVCQKLPSVEKQ